VPTLELDNGERLTDGPAILQWIADQVRARNSRDAQSSRLRSIEGPVEQRAANTMA
jgi:glutathione S-transferase